MELKGGRGMLVLFSVKNFASFKEEACLDMRAVKAYKEHEYNLHTLPNGEHLLKVAAIYGANASGKSNFVKAYGTFVDIVRDSFNTAKDGKSVLEQNYSPYLLANDSIGEDTEFSAIFVDSQYQYEYGFTYNTKQITTEWLYRTALEGKRRVRTTIFERDSKRSSFGASVEGICSKYQEDIKDDVLVLTFFSRIKLRTNAFTGAFDTITSAPAFFTYSQKEIVDFLKIVFKKMESDHKADLLNFFKNVDIRVKDFKTEIHNEETNIFFIHSGADGQDHSLPIEVESEGTRKAIFLYALASIALEMGATLFIDELNMQLHPLLTRYIVNLFHTQKGRGQLIYTTHDTTLLDNSFFRRDEVWFVDRAETCESTLYSLSEFAIRKDSSYESEYLGGAYGGIPILQNTQGCEV